MYMSTTAVLLYAENMVQVLVLDHSNTTVYGKGFRKYNAAFYKLTVLN